MQSNTKPLFPPEITTSPTIFTISNSTIKTTLKDMPNSNKKVCLEFKKSGASISRYHLTLNS